MKTTITLTIAFTLLAASDSTVERVDTILAWLTAAWVFAFGTCVGSFLNVVIYRLPAGMSIVLPGSHCPKCKHAIRAYDNIPILSWLVLRGRCRDCGATISPRYATIELLAGLALLGLYLADVAMGWGLPLESAVADVANGASVATPTWLPWIALCYHALLLSTLLCAAAIEWDRNAVPTKLFAPALIVGIAAPMALRTLHPLAVSRDFDSWLTSRVPDGAAHVLASLATSFAGFALGALLGYVTSFSQRPDSTARIDRRAAVLLAGLVGLILGWQSAVVLASAASLAFLIIAILSRPFPRFRSIPWSAGLTILVALYMMNGRAFVELLDRPGSGASLLMLPAAIGVTLLCAVAARTVMSKR